MSIALKVNTIDSLMGLVSNRTLDILNLLGQDSQRGYRKSLDCLWNKYSIYSFCSSDCKLESIVIALDTVVNMIDIAQRIQKCPNDDKVADLVAFIIQRLRHTDVLKENNNG